MFLEGKDNIYDLQWSDDVTYRDLRFEEERQFSEYNFNQATVKSLREWFALAEKEAAHAHRQGPAASGLRHVPQVLAFVQPARRPGRDQRHRAGQDDRPDPDPGQPGRPALFTGAGSRGAA